MLQKRNTFCYKLRGYAKNWPKKNGTQIQSILSLKKVPIN